MKKQTRPVSVWRSKLTIALFIMAFMVVSWRAIDLQVMNNSRYQNQGDAAHLRTVLIPAHRGMISDRNGEPLAISTPLASIWANPNDVLATPEALPALAKVLGLDKTQLTKRLEERDDKEFVYLKRQVAPDVVKQVKKLAISGVNWRREFRRYYPTGEVAAHVLGFTNVDDKGQEGIELAYDDWLDGTQGRKRVLQDRRGHIIADVKYIEDAKQGKDLTLSLDRRIQYLAYRSLKAAVRRHGAKGGVIVILDVNTGEVLAMVNQPAFNPNARGHNKTASQRNRAVTDVFEPGSTLKPFIIAAALESGVFSPKTVIDTNPGLFSVGRHSVRDSHNYGRINLTTILQKSSNVGVSKIALTLNKETLWNLLVNVGFGSVTASGFPGEHSGVLNDYHQWRKIDHATLAFGYGISVNALQLVQAYSVIADHGVLKPVSLRPVETPITGRQVIEPSVANQVRKMLTTVVSDKGTAPLARIAGYTVAGKTGTVRKHKKNGGYSKGKYLSLFIGMAPASSPRLVAVVIVDEPSKDKYYGGLVAAPVFAQVMAGAMRLLDIAPDDLSPTMTHVAAAVKSSTASRALGSL